MHSDNHQKAQEFIVGVGYKPSVDLTEKLEQFLGDLPTRNGNEVLEREGVRYIIREGVEDVAGNTVSTVKKFDKGSLTEEYRFTNQKLAEYKIYENENTLESFKIDADGNCQFAQNGQKLIFKTSGDYVISNRVVAHNEPSTLFEEIKETGARYGLDVEAGFINHAKEQVNG